MKKIILFSIFSLGLNLSLFAQDVIVDVSGNQIKVKVIKVTQTEVEYQYWESAKDKNYTIPRNIIKEIRYQDGYVLVNDPKKVPIITVPQPTKVESEGLDLDNPIIKPKNRFSGNELYRKGFSDAVTYYGGYQNAGTGTIVLTVLGGGIVGLIPAIACSTTPPKFVNLNIPPSDYSRDSQYIAGYTDSARKIKSRKVWNNYGTGVGILFGLGIMLALSSGGGQ
jgi:hypothetical protein